MHATDRLRVSSLDLRVAPHLPGRRTGIMREKQSFPPKNLKKAKAKVSLLHSLIIVLHIQVYYHDSSIRHKKAPHKTQKVPPMANSFRVLRPLHRFRPTVSPRICLSLGMQNKSVRSPSPKTHAPVTVLFSKPDCSIANGSIQQISSALTEVCGHWKPVFDQPKLSVLTEVYLDFVEAGVRLIFTRPDQFARCIAKLLRKAERIRFHMRSIIRNILLRLFQVV